MHILKVRFLILILLVCGAALTACGSRVPVIKPFKMDIQQGNVVTSKMLLQLRPGMTKSQVKFIMGSPLILDSFHSNRWDYFYQLRQAGKVVEQRRVILDFEKDLLTRVRGDVVPQGADSNAVTLAKEVEAPVKKVEKEGVFENLQFWKNGETAPTKPADKLELATPKAEDKGLLSKLKFWEKNEVAKVPATETKAKVLLKEAAPESAVSSSSLPEVPSSGAILPDAILPDTEAPSMLAVPIAIGTMADLPAVELPKNESNIEPNADALKVAPQIETAKIETSTVDIASPDTVAAQIVKNELPTIEPSAPAPVIKYDERFIFRLDRNLNLKNLEKTELRNELPTPSSKADGKLPTQAEPSKAGAPQAQPSYFERMLEKIGF